VRDPWDWPLSALIGARARARARTAADRESAVDAERAGLLDEKRERKVGKHNRKVRMLFAGR